MSMSYQVGLGTALRKLTTWLRIPTCTGCANRAAALDQRFVLFVRPIRLRRRSAAADGCWRYTSSCTGFGSKQCVTGPARQEPDSEMVTQCCSGWFQYAWIEVCPGQNAQTGCGFCFW